MALEVFSDLSERINYNLPGFPLYARKGELREFDRYAAACHWHPDLEYIRVQSGGMDYFVNGQTLHMDAGEGIFVNSRRLHYGFSRANADCSFLVVCVHPSLLGEGTPAGSAYIESQFGFSAEDAILLTDRVDWQRDALADIHALCEKAERTSDPLRLLAYAARLCAGIGGHIRPAETQRGEERAWLAVWRMTGLMRYRVQKSCEMLRETQMPVIEVALACGFQSASYFAQVFRRAIGLTPREYRNQAGQPGQPGPIICLTLPPHLYRIMAKSRLKSA